MRPFQLLASINPEITPKVCKVHLHKSVPEVDPLDAWHQGTFDDFQRWQTTNTYTRQHAVALIRNGRGSYMFAGLYRVLGKTQHAKNNFEYGNPDIRLVPEVFPRAAR